MVQAFLCCIITLRKPLCGSRRALSNQQSLRAYRFLDWLCIGFYPSRFIRCDSV